MSLLGALRARGIARGLFVFGLLLLLVVLRVVVASRGELNQADGYRARGELERAVLHYRRAARWHAPGSPYHVRALSRLFEIGEDAERRGDRALALSVYRAARGAIMATRSFYVPEQAKLETANRRIASLMAAMPAPPMDAGKSLQTLAAEHLTLLSKDPGPHVGWTLLLLLGFLTWVLGALAFSVRAIDDEDRFVALEVKRWGAVIAVGFGLFVLGMTLA